MGVNIPFSGGHNQEWEPVSRTQAMEKRGMPGPRLNGPHGGVRVGVAHSQGHPKSWESISRIQGLTPKSWDSVFAIEGATPKRGSPDPQPEGLG